jgi:hypothetical protein
VKRRLLVALALLVLVGGAVAGILQLRATQRLERKFAAAIAAEEKLRSEIQGEQPGSEPTPLELGPGSGYGAEKPEELVLKLLSGRFEASRFPLIATSNNGPFDDGLRDRLSPLRRPRVIRDFCDCPPGDPLCECF